jgi:hypothetical protein
MSGDGIGLVRSVGLVQSETRLERPQTGFQRPPSDLSSLWPASRGFTPDSREVHWTCSVKYSSNSSFEVGAINRPPWAIGHIEKRKASLRSKAWALSSLPKASILILIFMRRFELPWVCHLQARVPHPLSPQPCCICYSWGFNPLDG